MANKLGSLLMIGVQGHSLTTDEARFIRDNEIAGVCLFSRNLDNPEQIFSLCQEIQALAPRRNEPLFIATDMEGGRVHRLPPPFTQWPALKHIGDLNSPTAAFKFTLTMGEELRSVGINLDFAPCIDIFTNPKNQVIGDRALSDDPEVVSELASALVRGYIKSGIVSCGKHYPGHGNTLLDSHEDLPVESVSAETLESRELEPFKRAFRARMQMVMTAHIKYTALDPEHPATLSKAIVTDLLKGQHRFRGVVITDDLDMKALTKHYATDEIPVMALKAGCDYLLYCNEPESPGIALEALEKAIADKRLDPSRVEDASGKVQELRVRTLGQLPASNLTEAARLVGKPEHQALAKAIQAGQVPASMLT